MTNNLYEKDFYKWTIETVKLLKDKSFDKIDVDHLIEEVESMGISERRELQSRLEVLFIHLLKWQYQKNARSSSWEGTIKEQRKRLIKLLIKMPSLAGVFDQEVEEAYDFARDKAIYETGLSETIFPIKCPFESKEYIISDKLPS